ncbi:family 43 glycosylhydrolase [Paenibacillus luteus]|uniref:family 43 glycosylhydrolase n=1 Tax=Paenibacillus luteus TaxID=2545753 RepID=UPI001375E0EF|nr:family 43 glycosylhydrolase [Paenibacillus luteus]
MGSTKPVYNGRAWKDTDGQGIRAHGGWMLQQDGYYYWFGEDRTDGKKVSCYRSSDLRTWENRGAVLTLQSKVQPTYYRTSLDLYPPGQRDTGYEQGAVIERPKVLRNELTGKYVMWMHWENGKNYHDARCAVATCDTVDGEYVYHGSFNPIGHMSRDCTVFQDDDGTAYFMSAARDNADLLIYRLSDDYLSIDEHVKTLWPGQYREAPAMIKRRGVYFLITSACTGWLPNQGAYAYSDSLTGKWSQLLPFGDTTTFDSQPAFIVPLEVQGKMEYWYVGDRWDPSSYHDSSYVFLPLSFPSDKEMKLEWTNRVALGDFVDLNEHSKPSSLHRIKSSGTERYLAAEAVGDGDADNAVKASLDDDGATVDGESGVAGHMADGTIGDGESGVVSHMTEGIIGDRKSGDYSLMAVGTTTEEKIGVVGRVLSYKANEQKWMLEKSDDAGFILIRSSSNGRYLSVSSSTAEIARMTNVNGAGSHAGEGTGDIQVQLLPQWILGRSEWALEDADHGGKRIIRNRLTGKVLTAKSVADTRSGDASLYVQDEAEHDYRNGRDPQRFEILNVF